MPTLADIPYRSGRFSAIGPLSFMSRMDPAERTNIFVAIIVLVTILAAIAMLPNTEEKAQVLLSQGRVEDAISLYETRRETAQLNPFEAYSLAGLYRDQGKAGLLVRLLEDARFGRVLDEVGCSRGGFAEIARFGRRLLPRHVARGYVQ